MASNTEDSPVGPNTLPLGLGSILILLSLRLLYETFKVKHADEPKISLDYKRFAIILIAAILYAFLLETLGYVICTFIFLLVGFQTMSKGKWIPSLVIALAFSFGVYYLYVDLMNGSLPGLPEWLGFE